MELGNNYSTVGFSGRVPVKNWKTKDGKKFVEGLKDVVQIQKSPKADQFLKREPGITGYRCYQANSNASNLGEITNEMIEGVSEKTLKKLTGWLPK